MIFGLAGISFLSTELGYASGCFVLGLGIIGLLWYRFSQKKDSKDVWTLVKELERYGFQIKKQKMRFGNLDFVLAQRGEKG